MQDNRLWFRQARYGLFIHYGLYSLLGRGEWVMNREQIPVDEYAKLANQFTASKFNADDIIRRARDWGMRYAVLTTKHHDGFCLYDSKLTDFTAPKTAAGRDLVAEFVNACRKHGLRVGLYHTLGEWTHNPCALDALERPDECYQPWIDYVHGQIREIMTNYGKIDIMWYDGWWPFDAKGWQAEKLNAMVRALQPGILVNGRTGLAGDFGTPEGHISAQKGMWEACITHNGSWGYHAGDHDWKTPKQVTLMLQQVSAGGGNLLLNTGPRGDGSIPEETIRVFDQVGKWLKTNGEAIYDTERFSMNLRERAGERADWNSFGPMTASSRAFYVHVTKWPGPRLVLTGLECDVTQVTMLSTGRDLPYTQQEGRITVTGLPETADTTMPIVIRFRTKQEPCIYRTAGWRNPTVPHCRYDPAPSDIEN